MSDIMRPIPFDSLMDWILNEYRSQGTIFGVPKGPARSGNWTLPILAVVWRRRCASSSWRSAANTPGCWPDKG